MAASSIAEYQEMIRVLVSLLEQLQVIHSVGPFRAIEHAKELVDG